MSSPYGIGARPVHSLCCSSQPLSSRQFEFCAGSERERLVSTAKHEAVGVIPNTLDKTTSVLTQRKAENIGAQCRTCLFHSLALVDLGLSSKHSSQR